MSINTRRNIAKDANPTFLKTCRFDESNEETLYCPIFSLKQIVDMIVPKQDFRNISVKVCILVCVCDSVVVMGSV